MSDVALNAKKHGHASNGVESPTYRSWKAMKRRCGNDYYGPYKNVEMDPRWVSFDAFLSDMGPRPDGTTLDRIDGSLGYNAQNCRWATKRTQNQNRKIVVLGRDDAKRVLALKGSGARPSEVAQMFGCSACNVRDIWAGRSWGDLK